MTLRWQTVALGMPRLCSAQRLAGQWLEVNLLWDIGVNN
ncbi:diguanylate cyclase regulator RdcB family protein [Shigella flexneri]